MRDQGKWTYNVKYVSSQKPKCGGLCYGMLEASKDGGPHWTPERVTPRRTTLCMTFNETVYEIASVPQVH